MKSRLLTIPEFVNSGIAFSRDAEDADLSIQLGVEADGDENGLEYLNASNAKTNLWDRVSFVWPAADYEEVIARKAVKLLFAHCVARRENIPQPSQLLPEMVKQRLAVARTIRPVVHTSWMREEVLFAALKARPEFAEWGIEIGSVNERSDVDIVVGHVLSTLNLTWTFQLVDRESGSLLDSGTVVAFNHDRAASRIAAATVRQIAARRPLQHPNRLLAAPSKAPHTVVTQQPPETVVYQGPVNPETWVIKAVSENMIKRFPERMRLFIQDGNLMASDLKGRMLFSIPGDSILDFADTKSYDTLGDNIRLDDDNWNGCGEGCLGVILYVPALVVLDRFRINQHIFEIAWTEDGTIHVASLQMTKGDYDSLLSTLTFLMPQ